MNFDAIRDQETAIRLLSNVIENDRIPNGLLFWGPDGVGKHTTARAFAKALNCEAGTNACGDCLACRKIDHGNHPDIKTVQPVKRSRNIDVDTIESINEMAALRPLESDWRIFMILDADRMREPAQNHFLKTLEEPPGRSLFILVTSQPRMLLPTIRSRCQMVRFRSLSPDTVTDLLQDQREISTQSARAIANLAQGQMTRALDLVDTEKRYLALSIPAQLAAGDDPSILADEFVKALDGQRKQIEAAMMADGPEESEGMSREDRERIKEEQQAALDAVARRDIVEYLYLLETWYRDEMVYQSTNGLGSLLNGDHIENFREGTSRDPGAKIEAIEQARHYLDRFIGEDRVFRDLFFALAAK